jgi:WD40 repeat protein
LVYDVAFDARGTLLAAAAVDSVWVWEVESAEVPQAVQDLPSKNLNQAHFGSDGVHIVSAGEDGLVRLRDRAGALHAAWPVHEVPARDLCLSPDGRFIASVGVDGTLVVQEGKTGAVRHRLSSGDRLRAVACSPDGIHVVTGGSEGVARIWDAILGKLVRTIESRANDTLFVLLYSVDGSRIIAGHHSGLIEIWDSASGRRQRALKGHTSIVHGLATDRSGRTLASTARDQTVRLWNLADGEGRVLAVAEACLLRPSWDLDGQRLAVPTANGEILVWDVSSGDLLARVRAHRGEASDVEISPDGLNAVSSGEDGVLRLWETRGWRPMWFARAALWTPELELLTHTGWHALDSARQLVSVAPPSSHWLRAVESAREAVQQPGGPICVASDSGLAIWDVLRDAQVLFETLAPPFEIVSLPTGCSVLKDGRVTLYRPGEAPREVASEVRSQNGGEKLTTLGSFIGLFDAGGRPRGTFGRGDGATAAAPFGERIAVGFSDGAIELRDTGGRAPIYFKETSASAVTRLGMGPAGTLVAGFADGSFGVWSASSGELLERSAVHGAVQQLIVHGGMLIAASEVGSLAALDLSLLTADYCSLLQEVWSRVPVLWREQGAVLQAPEPSARCGARK